jgi:hypothetical protein
MSATGRIKYAKLETSERLQRLKRFLQDGLEHTTLEIIQGAAIAAVNSAVDELRANGFHITCRRLDRNRWTYRLHRCPKCYQFRVVPSLFGPECASCGALFEQVAA